MCWMMIGAIAGGALSMGGAAQTAEAQKAGAEYGARVNEINSSLNLARAAEVKTLGHMAEEDKLREVHTLEGRQRAVIAGNNVEGGSGSALQIQAETAAYGAADAQKIRANAMREAWGYQVESVNQLNDAQISRLTGQMAARGTMLTGAGNAIGSFSSAYGRG